MREQGITSVSDTDSQAVNFAEKGQAPTMRLRAAIRRIKGIWVTPVKK